MTSRRRWLLALLVALVVVRVALPIVVRRIAESQASQRLRARVHIGDVDLGLLRGAVALDDVAVRPAEAPDDPAAPDPPVIEWKRFAVNLTWWPLVHKTIRLSSVELDEPHVALDRLAGGDINLLALLPPPPEAAEAPPPPGATPGAASAPWGIGIDRLRLAGGSVRFRDFEEKAEPIDIGLPTIEVHDVSLQPGLYGRPARADVDVRIDEGRVRSKTFFWLHEGTISVATTLRARRLPLRRARVYAPDLGWRELTGQAGASIVHRFDTGTRDVVRGTVTLDDVQIGVPDLPQPLLEFGHLGVRVDPLDLEHRRVTVQDVTLDGATALFRVRGGPPLRRPPPGRGAAPPPAAAPAPPWHWSLVHLHVGDSRARLLVDDTTTDVSVTLEASGIADEGDEPGQVKLALAWEPATLAVEGRLRALPPGFDGTVALADLDLSKAVALAGVLPPDTLREGTLGADLQVAVGSRAPVAGDAVVKGSLGLSRFSLEGADAKEFQVALASLDVDVDELRVHGALGGETGGSPGPVDVRLARVALAEPSLQLTRTESGLVLPPLGGGGTDAGGGEAAASPAAEVATGAGAAPGAESGQPPAATAPALDVSVAALQVEKGSLRVTDRTVEPEFRGGFAPFTLDARDVRWPGLAADQVKLQATSLTGGRLTVSGRMGPAGGRFEVNGRRLALVPFNPYATRYSPYSITSGTLDVTTTATFRKGGAYDSKTALALRKFDVGGQGGASLFREEFGVPIEVALALLRDVEGKIALDIPVAGDERGTSVGIMDVAGQALRHALVNALASPLKLVGAALGGGNGMAAPTPIEFAVGRAEATSAGEEHEDALVALLASRPALGVTLEAAPTAADVRFLAEQALLRDDLAKDQGFFGAIGHLSERGARQRVRAALEARARGEEGALDDEDARKLDEWLAERPPPSNDAVRALLRARLDQVATTLRARPEIGSDRVATAEPTLDVREGDPVVEFELGTAGAAG